MSAKSKQRIPALRSHSSGQVFVEYLGRRKYLGKEGSPEARNNYARYVAAFAESPATAFLAIDDASAHRLTINELILGYYEHAEKHYQKNGKPTSELGSIRPSLRTLRQLHGTTPAKDFGPLKLKAVRQQFIDQGLARKTVNQRVEHVRRAFKWAVENELVPPTVLMALKAVAGLQRGRTTARETEPVPPAGDATIEATLPHLPPVVADMVRFQRLTGARPSEVCELRPGDLNRDGEVWEYRPSQHKTQHRGRGRVVFIGPRAQDVLRPYLLRAADACCFSPAESERKRRERRRQERKSKLTPSQRKRALLATPPDLGERYTKDSYNRAVGRAVAKANGQRLRDALAAAGVETETITPQLEYFATARKRDKATRWAEVLQGAGIDPADVPMLMQWTPNQLRHAAATELRKHYGLEAAQVVLGHSFADVTQIYAERDLAKAAAVMKQIG